MKTAYKITWADFSIHKVLVVDDWTEDLQHQYNDYLVWATFENAQAELISGLQAELNELKSYTEHTYFYCPEGNYE